MRLGQSFTRMQILLAQPEAWRIPNVEEEGYCDDELFYLLTGVDCHFKSPRGNLIWCFFSIELFPDGFQREQLKINFANQGMVLLQGLYLTRFRTLARWLCYEAVAIESSPFLSPSHQSTIVSALPLKAPSEKTFDLFSCWLDARIGGANESLS